ncbi:hypothetical protein E2C01_052825 [Portunus trituberculatus]|uniref:Uncharacterized protein n=1 Tax=Portunus trituberculatus TaxID=210409 RepID=A0A5B7GMV1_PORTR|nr:hypothetical protein [Portunus trituberculatus]
MERKARDGKEGQGMGRKGRQREEMGKGRQRTKCLLLFVFLGIPPSSSFSTSLTVILTWISAYLDRISHGDKDARGCGGASLTPSPLHLFTPFTPTR